MVRFRSGDEVVLDGLKVGKGFSREYRPRRRLPILDLKDVR
jgi:hypothetical protein